MENFLKLLKGTKQEEFEQFLEIYQSFPKHQFGVMKVSGSSVHDNSDMIAQDVALMNQYGIHTPIVHGAGSHLDELLPDSEKKDGIRITKKEDIPVIQQACKDIGNDLATKIMKYGGKAIVIDQPIFECDHMSDYGHVGSPLCADTDNLKTLVDAGITPIVSFLGNVPGLGTVNVNGDHAATKLVEELKPKKYLLVTPTGGILDQEGNMLPYINLSEIDNLDFITEGMLVKIKALEPYLRANPDSSVSITSSFDLIREIFTVKGSGTFVKYHDLKCTNDKNDVDQEKLKQLLESSIGKQLDQDYFNSDIAHIVYESHYKGVAIVKEMEIPGLGNIPYVCKFAVDPLSQATGLGSSMMDKIKDAYPTFFLRASPENKCNDFYAKHLQGNDKGNQWNAYWNGLKPQYIPAVIDAVNNVPATMKK